MKQFLAFSVIVATILAISSCGNVVSKQLPQPLGISPSSAPAGTVGFNYSLTLSATGGQAPYAWSVATGSLPQGLTLDANSGVISGVPSLSGTFDFTVHATDSSVPARTGSMLLALVVNGQLAFSISSLPDAAVTIPYNTPASVTGGAAPYTWSVASGSLPPGLSLNSATGVISGTPTAAGGYGFGLKVTDSSNPQQTAKFFGGINVYSQLTITSTSLPDATVGSSYSTTLTATGGTGSYTWSISSGNLPDGISLDPNTGILSGTPTTAGLVNFSVQATDTANPPQDPSLPVSINVDGNGANDRLMKGSYAFLLQGFDSNGAVASAGIIEADGSGSIVSGVFDINRISGVSENVLIDFGHYAIQSDNRGTLTLHSELGTQTFRIAMNADGTLAHFIEFEASGPNVIRGNGVLKKRDVRGVAAPVWSGRYAFAFSGSTSMSRRSAMVGSFSADAEGTIDSGLCDSNSDGVVVQEGSIRNVSNYKFAANGRGTLALVVDQLDGVSGAAYFVSPRESFFVRTGQSGNDSLSGEILTQSGSPFSDSAISGPAVIYLEGLSVTGHAVAGLGELTFEGSVAIGGTYDVSDGAKTASTPVSSAGYEITAPDFGRGTMNFAGNNLVFYAADPSTALVMDAAGREVKTGLVEAQEFNTTASSAPEGRFAAGSRADTDSNVTFESGMTTFATSPHFTVIADLNPPSGVLSLDSVSSGSISSTTSGRTEAADGTIYYVVSPSRVIALRTPSGISGSTLLFLDQ